VLDLVLRYCAQRKAVNASCVYSVVEEVNPHVGGRRQTWARNALAPFLLAAATLAGCTASTAPKPPASRTAAELTADFALPDGIFGVAVGDGAAWVTTGNSVLRVDPTTDRTRQLLSIPGASFRDIVFGDGNLWLTGAGGILRVDPVTGKVTGRVAVAAGTLAFGEGAVWSIGPRLVTRIDPATFEVRRTQVPLGKVGGLAAGEGSVWFSTTGGCRDAHACLVRMDPTTGRITARIGGDFSLASVAVGDGAVWASDGTTVERIDAASNRVAATTVLASAHSGSNESPRAYGSGLLAVAPGIVWVTVATSASAARVARIDPATGHLAATLMAVAAGPGALAAIGHTLWLVTDSDALTRIDLVSCRATHCSPPAPPAPTIPHAQLRPIAFQSLQMFPAGIGWSFADLADAGPAPSPGFFPTRTTDGGRTWIDVMPVLAKAITHPMPSALFALSPERAWLAVTSGAGAERTTVFATGNGGLTWAASSGFRTGGTPRFLDFTDASHGWLLVDIGEVMGADEVSLYRTTDGGSRWSLVARSPAIASPGKSGLGGLPLYCGKAGLSFATSAVGWIPVWCNGGNGWGLLVTHDGGETWAAQAISIPASDCPPALCEVSAPQFFGATGFAPVKGSSSPMLLVTHDGGSTWSAATLPSEAGRDPDVWFVSATVGWLVASKTDGTDVHLFETVDGARTWSPILSNLSAGTLDFVSPTMGFAASAAGLGAPVLSATTDGGRYWVTFVPVLGG
jgi:hypothetical protein